MRNSQQIGLIQEKQRIQDYTIFQMQKEIRDLQDLVRKQQEILKENGLIQPVQAGPDLPVDEDIQSTFKRFNWKLGEFQ